MYNSSPVIAIFGWDIHKSCWEFIGNGVILSRIHCILSVAHVFYSNSGDLVYPVFCYSQLPDSGRKILLKNHLFNGSFSLDKLFVRKDFMVYRSPIELTSSDVILGHYDAGEQAIIKGFNTEGGENKLVFHSYESSIVNKPSDYPGFFYILDDLRVSEGMSGCPIFNAKDELIGLLSRRIAYSSGNPKSHLLISDAQYTIEQYL